MNETNKIITLASGVKYTLKEFSKLNKQALVDIAIANKQVFDPSISKEQLLTLLVQNLGEVVELKSEELDGKPATIAELKKRLAVILKKGAKINEALETMDDDEKVTFLKTSLNEMGIADDAVADFIDLSDPANIRMVASDLPKSQIIASLPVRVKTQKLREKLVSYPMMQFVAPELVSNGIIDMIYPDFRDADDKSGFDDVVIDDYNMGLEPLFQETYPVDTNIHKGYDVLDSKLNDVALTPGLFIAMTDDYARAIAHPMAKAMYKRFLTYLADSTNFDEQIAFTDADIVEKSKQLYEHIVSLQTPSRTNLKVTPNGSNQSLEYVFDTTKSVIVMNKAFAGQYKYDLKANTFQLGEVTIEVGKILVQDFAKLDEYLTGANKLSDLELILFESGVYKEIVHFDGTKQVDTPKLKTVINDYTRVGNFRTKDQYLGAFKPMV